MPTSPPTSRGNSPKPSSSAKKIKSKGKTAVAEVNPVEDEEAMAASSADEGEEEVVSDDEEIAVDHAAASKKWAQLV